MIRITLYFIFPLQCAIVSALDFTAICFDHQKMNEDLYYDDSGEFRKLVLRASRRSLPAQTQLDENGMLKLYIKNQSPAPDAPPFLVTGDVAVHSQLNRILLFISPSAGEGDTRLRLTVIEDDYKTFPGGSFRFINLSGQKLGVLLGEEKALIPNKEMKTIRADIDEGNYVQVQLVGKTGFVYQSTWYCKHNSRELIVMMPDKDGKSVRLAMFNDKVRL